MIRSVFAVAAVLAILLSPTFAAAPSCPAGQTTATDDIKDALSHHWTVHWISQFQLFEFRQIAKERAHVTVAQADAAYIALDDDPADGAYLSLVNKGCVFDQIHLPTEVARQIIGVGI